MLWFFDFGGVIVVVFGVNLEKGIVVVKMMVGDCWWCEVLN